MSVRVRGGGSETAAPEVGAGARPVMLATFDVPFERVATELAVDAAVETGQQLIVVNVAPTPILPVAMRLGYAYLETSELTDALRAPAELASSLSVPAELLRVSSPRPVTALLELVAERRPGMLVFGPERSRLGNRRYERAARRIRERAPCLVWLAD